MKKYAVYYNNWRIEVEANSIKQARHRAYIKFNESFPTPYGQFMRGIQEVDELVA